MNVVVNATPLISLALVGQLSLLHEMFDAVIVPRAVYEEVVLDGYGQPGAAELAQASWRCGLDCSHVRRRLMPWNSC